MRLGLNQRLGLSRNKVAVPEGVAGTPPFWGMHRDMRTKFPRFSGFLSTYLSFRKKRGDAGLVAQVVRALH